MFLNNIYIYYQILFKETIAGSGAKEIWDLAVRCERNSKIMRFY